VECGHIGLPNRRKNKYGAVRTTIDGITFDSAAESRRWQQLRAMEAAGEIWGLERQVRLPLRVEEVVIGVYVGDFRYCDCTTRELVIEDVKGGDATKTPLYRWKRKHVLAQYGYQIREVTA
jgi:hypothetical protein